MALLIDDNCTACDACKPVCPNEAIAVGDPIYITPANALSGTASGNALYGHALTTKAAAAGPLTVRIAN